MTLRQFYTTLEDCLKTDPVAHPHYAPEGALRLHRGTIFYYCPITYVAQRLGLGEFDCTRVHEAAAVLGLPWQTMQRIMRASDNVGSPEVRQQLETLWRVQ